MNLEIAVLIPCYNEEKTIKDVVAGFKNALPQAIIYVYDNNSSDNTLAEAQATEAIVRKEILQGKGNVVKRMFADIEADIYLLVDGDSTYDASSAPILIKHLVDNSLDMVNAARSSVTKDAYRLGHGFGNKLLTGIVSFIFGKRFNDMLSGYRVFSHRYVKSFPIFSSGFEIETEFTVHALQQNLPIAEINTPYYARPEGSVSKLSTYKDGFRILKMIFLLVKRERPLAFFSAFSIGFLILSIFAAWPIFITYFQTGLVPRLPTAILSLGLMILASLSFVCGLILDTVTYGRKENKRLHYLSYKPISDRRNSQ